MLLLFIASLPAVPLLMCKPCLQLLPLHWLNLGPNPWNAHNIMPAVSRNLRFWYVCTSTVHPWKRRTGVSQPGEMRHCQQRRPFDTVSFCMRNYLLMVLQ